MLLLVGKRSALYIPVKKQGARSPEVPWHGRGTARGDSAALEQVEASELTSEGSSPAAPPPKGSCPMRVTLITDSEQQREMAPWVAVPGQFNRATKAVSPRVSVSPGEAVMGRGKAGEEGRFCWLLAQQASGVASPLSHHGYGLQASSSSAGLLPRSFLLIALACRNSTSENTKKEQQIAEDESKCLEGEPLLCQARGCFTGGHRMRGEARA